jgi:pimeloyl-ACP methyl ester carboxylesterase
MAKLTKAIAATLVSLVSCTLWPPVASAERVVSIAVPVGPETNLIGSLHLPKTAPPYPAIVFVHGSESVPRAQEYEIIGGEHLVAAGFAVLVVDKRGVGDTPGTYEESYEIAEMSDDALSQVRFLKTRPDIRADAIGLFGVSRGGWVAPSAAAGERECITGGRLRKGECPGATHDIAFVVMISGPGVSPNEANIYQRGQELLAKGVSAADVERIAAYRRVLWHYYGGAGDYDASLKAFEGVKSLVDLLEPYEKTPLPPQALTHPALNVFRRNLYEPKDTLARVDVPSLAIYGAADRLIPVDESVRIVTEAFRGHALSRVVVIPAAGHGMRVQGQPGLPQHTAGPPPPFAPGYWETLIPWLKERARK